MLAKNLQVTLIVAVIAAITPALGCKDGSGSGSDDGGNAGCTGQAACLCGQATCGGNVWQCPRCAGMGVPSDGGSSTCAGKTTCVCGTPVCDNGNWSCATCPTPVNTCVPAGGQCGCADACPTGFVAAPQLSCGDDPNSVSGRCSQTCCVPRPDAGAAADAATSCTPGAACSTVGTTCGPCAGPDNYRCTCKAPGTLGDCLQSAIACPACGDNGQACCAVARCNGGLACCSGVPYPEGGVCATECNLRSDRAQKGGIETVDVDDVLERLMRLRVQSWVYREDPAARHLGPMAQDFFATYHLGSSDRVISAVDANGVLMAAIQALGARVETLQRELSALRASRKVRRDRARTAETAREIP